MDSMTREALERIANECDIGEHTEIARKALLTAEPEPCEDEVDSAEIWISDPLVIPSVETMRKLCRRLIDNNRLLRNATQVADKRAEELRALREALEVLLDSENDTDESYKVAYGALAATEPKE